MHSLGDIRRLQNLPASQEILAAGRVSATLSKRVRGFRFITSGLIAGLAVFGPLIPMGLATSIAVISLGWVLLSRILLSPWEAALRRESAGMIDEFERLVLGISADSVIAGSRPSRFRVLELLRRAREDSQRYVLVDWFRVSDGLSDDLAAIGCLLYSARFGWRLAREWRVFVTTLWCGLVLGSIVLGLARNATLAESLVAIAIPLSPLILDLVESAALHKASARMRESVVVAIDEMLGEGSVGDQLLRDVLRAAYEWRTQTVGVPDFFYRWRRSALESEFLANG